MGMEDKRSALLEQLLEVAPVMLQGSLTRTTRTCGTPNCRCRRGQRHGPHTYLSFKTPEGRSSSLYVPVAELERFEEGVAAWKRFGELATQLANLNREEIELERRGRTGRGRKHAGGT